jgi:hypothetical protein
MEEGNADPRRIAMVLFGSVLFALQPVWCAPLRPAIGRVSGPGPVQLNGIAAPVGTNVYAGNRITTAPGAIGYVSLAQGGKLVLGGETSARIRQSGEGFSVQLESGALGAVSEAGAPIVVTAGGVTVRAKRSAGSFEVELNGKTLSVFARSGPAQVESANRIVEIGEDNFMRATLNPGETPGGNGQTLRGSLRDISIVRSNAGMGLDHHGRKPCHGISPSKRRHHHCDPD